MRDFGVFGKFSVKCQLSHPINFSRQISPQIFVKTICKDVRKGQMFDNILEAYLQEI